MLVHVFGNPDLPVDSLPLRILPALRERFPAVEFAVKDPNEEWDVPERFVMIDTVLGIDAPAVFTDLSAFVPAKGVSMHDFDAYANLRLLQKIGRLRDVFIVGLPPQMDEGQAVKAASALLAPALADG